MQPALTPGGRFVQPGSPPPLRARSHGTWAMRIKTGPTHQEEEMAQLRVACLLGSDFEDSEFRAPYDRLRKEGYQVDIIGTKAGQEVKGEKGKETVKTEKSTDEVGREDSPPL